MAASQPSSLLLSQKVSLPPSPHSEPSFLVPPSQGPVTTILAHSLPLFLSQFNSEICPLSGYFLPGRGSELTDGGIWRLLWSAKSRAAVPNKQEHTWSTNVRGGVIYTFFGNDLLDPSTTSCRSEPCCQWNVCDCTKMWKSANKVIAVMLYSLPFRFPLSPYKWKVRPTLLDS